MVLLGEGIRVAARLLHGPVTDERADPFAHDAGPPNLEWAFNEFVRPESPRLQQLNRGPNPAWRWLDNSKVGRSIQPHLFLLLRRA